MPRRFNLICPVCKGEMFVVTIEARSSVDRDGKPTDGRYSGFHIVTDSIATCENCNSELEFSFNESTGAYEAELLQL